MVVAVSALMISACVAGGSSSSTTLPGSSRLVVVDDSGDVVVLNPDGSGGVEITSDAGDSASYGQPIWSPDGSSVAFSQFNGHGFATRIQHVGETEFVEVPASTLPFYMFWSPDSRRLGTLRNGPDGLDFEMVDATDGSVELLDRGSPYYFTWTTDSEVVAHVGERGFRAFDLEGEAGDPGTTGPGYLAPQWTDAGLIHVDSGTLVIEAPDGSSESIAEVSGLTMFAASPTGDKVAFQSLGESDALSVSFEHAAAAMNTVVVADVESGAVATVAEHPALGFFWSPDGSSLLLLTVPSGATSVEVSVWSEDETTDLFDIVPSEPLLRDLLPFFPQYAQSMAFWSPDSAMIVLPGSIHGESGVWVQEIGGGGPQRVADGSWVAWSP